jgi:Anti-sigma-K factor rskA
MSNHNPNPSDEERYVDLSSFASVHEHVAELLGVYAIHAVTESEVELVELHLEHCETCQSELGQHFATAARLGAASVMPVAPRVWDNVLSEIRTASTTAAAPTQVPSPTVALLQSQGVSNPSGSKVVAAISATQSGPTSSNQWSEHSTSNSPDNSISNSTSSSTTNSASNNVVDFAAASKRLSGRRTWRVAIAAAVASAAITVPIVSSLSGSSPSLAAIAKQVAAQPSSRLLTLKSAAGAELANVVVGKDGQGYLQSDSLPKLSSGKAYQMWAVTETGPVSLGMLGADPSVQAFATPETYAALAISVEESKGATAPTPPIASAAV